MTQIFSIPVRDFNLDVRINIEQSHVLLRQVTGNYDFSVILKGNKMFVKECVMRRTKE